MDKKPHNVEEIQALGTSTANSAVPAGTPAGEFKPRYMDEAASREIMEKLFRVHGDVLRRLADYDRNG